MNWDEKPNWEGTACPIPLQSNERILLGHGSGGKLTAELIGQLFLPAFNNEYLARLDDQAVIDLDGLRLAFTTDAFVVTPIFFPGGDIGQLAVNGTVNDLAMSGAKPLYIAAAFILEEGLALEELTRVVYSMRKAALEAGVQLVAGDTKVVDRGKADKIFITTTGLAVVDKRVSISGDRARAGDQVILSGSIGDHGIAVLSTREHLDFEGTIESDTAPLHTLVAAMLDASEGVHCLRDPTRGGLATTLNEIAVRSNIGIEIEEKKIPMGESVKAACEILGLDPLYIANEGKLVAIVEPAAADRILGAMRKHPRGRRANIIGRVVAEHPRVTVMKTAIGSRRIVDVPTSEPLPRIC